MAGPVTMCTSEVPVSAAQAAFTEAAEAPSQPTKLFIGGISRHTTTKQLRDHFSQFGRVLDCVAMRTQDGHPRGFGYVTLDCPLAADHCLREPQVIDNRVVDMKLAVPEGSSSGTAERSKHTNFNAKMFAGQGAFSMDAYAGQDFNEWSAYGNAAAWWSGEPLYESSQMDGQLLDCLDVLRGPQGPQTFPMAHGLATVPGARGSVFDNYAELAEQDPLDGMGLLLPPFLSSENQSLKLPTDFQVKMSADAAEFVPSGPPGLTAMGSTPPTKNARKTARAKAPLGDVTNFINTSAADLLKPFKSPTKRNPDVGSGYLSASTSPTSGSVEIAGTALFDDSEPNTRSPSDTSPQLNSSIDSSPSTLLEPGSEPSKLDEQTVTKDQGDHTSGSRDAAGSDAESIDDSDDGEESVVRSLAAEGVVDADLPSAGSALHAAGECKRCNFFLKGRCQNGKDCEFCHFPHDKRKQSRQEKRERKAEWLSACGLSEGVQKELSGPVQPGLIGQIRPAALSADALEWHPGQQVSPSAYGLPAMSQTMPWSLGQGAFQHIVTAAPMSAVPLSTSPGSLFSTVPSPFTSAAPTPLASAAPTPLATPLPTPTASKAPSMMFSTPAPQPGNHMVGWKVAAEAARPNVEEHRWSREDLLRLRQDLMKTSVADNEEAEASSILQIRTAPIGTSGVF